ncbi:MAG: hypothetical protein NWE93_02435 [Candidatus Bathyarchaeota archaeon]|nr:hypothetical protein [Candidatus Bathyarchaeota archaeon]
MDFSLNGKWRFNGFLEDTGEQVKAYKPNYPDGDWLLGEVPGVVHTDLLANRCIADPLQNENESAAQWVSQREWWYRREFELPQGLAEKEALWLVFEGLDTAASIWLNGVAVGKADNMFRPWRFNVKEAALPGRNVLAVCFKPIYRVAAELERRYGAVCGCLHAENCSSRPYIRKAQYMFGWDWAPTLPTAGIWRSASLVGYDVAALGGLAVLPLEVSEEKAAVKLSGEVYCVEDCVLQAKFTFEGFGQKQEKTHAAIIPAGYSLIETQIEISKPQLWWPKGYGKPNLYTATLEITAQGKLLDRAEAKCGIRSVKLLQQSDDEGVGFVFAVNGREVFCRGANWVPADSFLPKVSADRYRALLTLASEANMNMLRVWGGGVYEDEEFYSLCDELGLMVWQDFMYACAAYPQTDWFLKAAEEEAELEATRLRGHPCIVVWCGNNEIHWQHHQVWRDREKPMGLPIFEEVIPRVLARLDGTRPYRASSPLGGEDPNSEAQGTRHNWMVWSKGADYLSYLEDRGRFLTEFGWQAPATLGLLKQTLGDADLRVDSAGFLAHQKQTDGLELMKRLLALHYPVPNDFTRFVLYSQLNQADALKTAVAHWRSRMPKTSGCLIWQLNDCWPAISWSLIDYGLNPKPAYYAVKRMLQPIVAPLLVKDGVARVFVVNESASELAATLKFTLATLSGEVLHRQEVAVKAPTFTSQLVLEMPLSGLPIEGNSVFIATLESNRGVLFEDAKTASEPKDLQLVNSQIRLESAKKAPGEFAVTLASELFAKAVMLSLGDAEGMFADNFFDLLPNKPKTIRCSLKRDISESEFQRLLRLDAYPYAQV